MRIADSTAVAFSSDCKLRSLGERCECMTTNLLQGLCGEIHITIYISDGSFSNEKKSHKSTSSQGFTDVLEILLVALGTMLSLFGPVYLNSY